MKRKKGIVKKGKHLKSRIPALRLTVNVIYLQKSQYTKDARKGIFIMG